MQKHIWKLSHLTRDSDGPYAAHSGYSDDNDGHEGAGGNGKLYTRSTQDHLKYSEVLLGHGQYSLQYLQ